MTRDEIIRQARTDAENLKDIRQRAEQMRSHLLEDWEFHAAVAFQLGTQVQRLLDVVHDLDEAVWKLRSVSGFVETSDIYAKRISPYITNGDTP